jgi:sulfur carrier protein ThiS
MTRVKLRYRDSEWEIKPGITVRDAILSVGLNPAAVLVMRNGKLLDENTRLCDGDRIKLIPMVSGG